MTAHTSNPVRIGRIGADHIQVSIRPAFDEAELLVLVDRLERLIEAGYDSIDVVFEGSDVPHDPARTTEQILEVIHGSPPISEAVDANGCSR